MNAGMEDIEVLMEMYDSMGSIKDAMNKYGTERPPDAHAIADLALYNYIEMRDLVTRFLVLSSLTLLDILSATGSCSAKKLTTF